MDIPKIEVVASDVAENPRCPHGPTLLFKRIGNGRERSFFACSACRDRKDCNFFLWADEKMTVAKKQAWDSEKEHIIPKINHKELHKHFLQLLKVSPETRAYCHTCSYLLLTTEVTKGHKNHDITIGISDHHLKHPSQILQPLENAKKEAQYLFSVCATNTIVGMAQQLGATSVLCIGAPRVHEFVQSEMSPDMNSLLLDIDHRYHHFNSPTQFCWFNSFNNYFFSEKEGLHVLSRFLKNAGESLVLVMDPPFGGRVEPLAQTVQEITKLHRKLCPDVYRDMTVFWVFPYFMEPQVLESCPDYTMLDYKVDYENHPLFTSGSKGRKYGSPVRIFTNAKAHDFTLPKEEGYKYCEICDCWVSEENQHCKLCNKCTSKDGRTYVHCNICKRCVKPSWEHCAVCERCCLPDHKCGEFVPSQLCFNCGLPGHKKQDCTNFKSSGSIHIKSESPFLLKKSTKSGRKWKYSSNKMNDEVQCFGEKRKFSERGEIELENSVKKRRRKHKT